MNRFREYSDCASVMSGSPLVSYMKTEEEVIIGIRVVSSPECIGLRVCCLGMRWFEPSNETLSAVDHGASDLVLNLEDIFELAVVGLRPDVVAVVDTDQLRGDSQRVAGLSDTAFKTCATPSALAISAIVVCLPLK